MPMKNVFFVALALCLSGCDWPEVPVWYAPAAQESRFTLVCDADRYDWRLLAAIAIHFEPEFGIEEKLGGWHITRESGWPDRITVYGPDGLPLARINCFVMTRTL
jgi:hypothetical protein